MGLSILTLIYIIAAVTFIMGLKMMSNPASARNGNIVAGCGMVAAIFGTIFLYRNPDGNLLNNHLWIFIGLAVGAVIGIMAAKKIKMTAMPEMVSLFNGLGGASATLISVIEFNHLADQGFPDPLSSGSTMAIIFAGIILGNITFSGSVVAWGKLSGKVKDFAFKGQHIINLILLAACLGLAIFIGSDLHSSSTTILFYTLFALSLLYGIFFENLDLFYFHFNLNLI